MSFIDVEVPLAPSYGVYISKFYTKDIVFINYQKLSQNFITATKILFYMQRSDQKGYFSFMFVWRFYQQSSKGSNLTHIKLLKSLKNLICKGYDLATVIETGYLYVKIKTICL